MRAPAASSRPRTSGVGMAERVARTHGNDGQGGVYGVEKRRRGRVRLPWCPTFRGRARTGAVIREQPLLARAAEIAGEERRGASPVEPQIGDKEGARKTLTAVINSLGACREGRAK